MKTTWIVAVLAIASTAYGDTDSIGLGGINSADLQLPNGMLLDGTGMGIGQVEGLRPGKPEFDNAANSAPLIVPDGVYRRNGAATANETWINNHAEEVAGVMISRDNRAPGVAPQALLHSSTPAPGVGQRDYALAAYHVARRTTTSGQGIDAINMSFGLSLDGFEDLAGSSHLTSFLDWSAARHDVLYVIAGNEMDGGQGPVPTDNYNGITVAASSNAGSFMGKFDHVWSQNDYSEDAEGDRVSVDILAPGEGIDVIQLGNGLAIPPQSGTSYAAPHVTGAVALLQQYAKYQIDESAARWTNQDGSSPNPRRHEVMKAVLLNSADKLFGVHGSTRTVFNGNSQQWDQTLAYSSPSDPLDEQMGAGCLNVGSALTNFAPGEYDPGVVPRIGWDFSTISEGSSAYTLNEAVPAGAWIAVTLAWDRIVTSSEVGNAYTSTTDFFDNPIEDELVNLDLYLLDGNDNVVRSSVAAADSVEHIFWQVPEGQGGDFKIRVTNAGGANEWPEGYGLAWWAGEAATTPGDFNGDGNVDGADLSKWKGDFGLNGNSDADDDGDSDGADFLVWQRNLGGGAGGGAASLTAMNMLAQVGEPGFDPAIGVVAESSSSSPPPIDDPLDVAGMRAVYDALTGGVTFEGLANIHGVGVLAAEGAALNGAGALAALVASSEEIGWLFLSGVAGGAFNGGTFLPPGLSDELSDYFIGVARMGSGKSVTPIPIVSGTNSYLPNFNPFASANVAAAATAVPEPTGVVMLAVGWLGLLRRSRAGRAMLAAVAAMTEIARRCAATRTRVRGDSWKRVIACLPSTFVSA